MIGEDSVKVFYERADNILSRRNIVLYDHNNIDRDIIKLTIKRNKLLAESRELDIQYKILVEAIRLVEPLFKKKRPKK